MSSVLFYDPLCRQPYDTRTLHACALGGTEATLTRVADALDAFVIQYNRAEDALTPDGTPVDERKLIFFSSPNKGLNFTLDAFSALKRRMPDLRLVVGNPGYKAGGDARRAGVEFLGPQPQARIHAEVRS